ncbi:hypothetical protein X965_11325 [Morganella sp. EGD-HP17]|nr:hypothetical protein X965_11325 [Morganella sp. EGD-HP17]
MVNSGKNKTSDLKKKTISVIFCDQKSKKTCFCNLQLCILIIKNNIFPVFN